MNNRELYKQLDEHYSQYGEIEDSFFLPWQYVKDDMHRYGVYYKDGTSRHIKLHKSYPEDSKHYRI